MQDEDVTNPPSCESLFRVALNSSTEGVFIVEAPAGGIHKINAAEWRFRLANLAYGRMFALPMISVEGKTVQECVPEEVRTVTLAYLNLCIQQGKSVFYEMTAETGERSTTWFTQLSPIAGHDGQVFQVVGICRDVSDLRQRVEQAHLLQSITQAIATSSDFDSALTWALCLVCKATGWVYADAWVPNADRTLLEPNPAWYCSTPRLEEFRTLSEGITFAPGQGMAGRVWITKCPEWIQDVSSTSTQNFVRAHHALKLGLRAGLNIPILANDEVVAVLGFYMTEARRADHPLVELVSSVTAQLGPVIKLKSAEAELRQAEEKYRSIFENAVEGIFQTTPDGQYVTVNPMLARIYGYDSPEELITTLTDIQHQLYVDPDRRDTFRRLMQEQDAVRDFESQIYRKDGSVIWIAENARTIRDAEGHPIVYEGTVEDITCRKEAEAELHKRGKLLRGVAAATNCLLIESDYNQAIAQALADLGTAAEVDRVYLYQNYVHPKTGELAMSLRYEWVRAAVKPLLTQVHWQNRLYSNFGTSGWYDRLSSGQSISVRTRELPLSEESILARQDVLSVLLVPILIDDSFWGYIGFDDCHSERYWSDSEESILVAMAASIGGALKRQQAEATIRYQAHHDLLTGLPNRALFNDRLPLALAHARRNHSMLAVMFLDLDRFKTINDTLGHAVGDRLLQEVAQRLLSCLRDEDTVSRWGGDEFTILLPQINHVEDAAITAQRILEALKPAFNLQGHELYVTSSIGVAIYPQDGDDCQTLLKNADAALYQVKEQGRNNFQIYVPAINSKASELLALESSLYQALDRGEFELYYQPQVNVATWEITRMEALLRWQHPELGEISPRVFIPLAEENGLIVPIGEWVLRNACAQHRQWLEMLQAQGQTRHSNLRVAVNLSARQFQQNRLVEKISQILTASGLDSHFLELEITETTVMQNVDFTTTMLHQFREMGVHLSLDDFGTGYSALGYLKKFPLHTVKIDQSFIQEMTSDPNDAAIVAAVVALGRGLNLSVVAEGVETIEQMEFLRSLQCEEMQGYLFSPALTIETATHFLQKNCLHHLPPVNPTLPFPQDWQISC